MISSMLSAAPWTLMSERVSSMNLFAFAVVQHLIYHLVNY